jgi:hypothetical protein
MSCIDQDAGDMLVGCHMKVLTGIDHGIEVI